MFMCRKSFSDDNMSAYKGTNNKYSTVACANSSAKQMVPISYSYTDFLLSESTLESELFCHKTQMNPSLRGWNLHHYLSISNTITTWYAQANIRKHANACSVWQENHCIYLENQLLIKFSNRINNYRVIGQNISISLLQSLQTFYSKSSFLFRRSLYLVLLCNQELSKCWETKICAKCVCICVLCLSVSTCVSLRL